MSSKRLPTIAIRILPEEYDAFVRLAPTDKEFAGSYYEWLEPCTKEDTKRVARGEVLTEVIIHLEEFVEYCSDTGQEPSYTVLRAAVVRKALRKA